MKWLGLLIFILMASTWGVTKFIVESRFTSGAQFDYFQYSAPFSQQNHFLDIRLPLLGEFPPFSNGWGMQWPLFMLLKSSIFSVLSYSPESNLVVGILLTVMGGLIIYKYILFKAESLILALCSSCVFMSDRMLWAFTGPGKWGEIIAAILLLLIFLKADELAASSPKRSTKFMFLLPFIMLPSLHPIGLAVVGGLSMICLLFAGQLFPLHTRWARLFPLPFFLAGLAAFYSWFYFQPAALEQLRINMQVQGLIQDTATRFTFFQNYLGKSPFGSGFLLWLPPLAISIYILAKGTWDILTKRKSVCSAGVFLASATVVAMPVLGFILRIDNFSYFILGSGAAIYVIANFHHLVGFRINRIWIPARNIIFIYSALSFLAIPSYHMLRYIKHGCPNLRMERRDIMESFSDVRRIYVPRALIWEASEEFPEKALMNKFPIPMLSSIRKDYEDYAYGDVLSGDILIVNFLEKQKSGASDRFQMNPIRDLYPPDPAQWDFVSRHKRTFPGAVEWGWDLRVFKKK